MLPQCWRRWPTGGDAGSTAACGPATVSGLRVHREDDTSPTLTPASAEATASTGDITDGGGAGSSGSLRIFFEVNHVGVASISTWQSGRDRMRRSCPAERERAGHQGKSDVGEGRIRASRSTVARVTPKLVARSWSRKTDRRSARPMASLVTYLQFASARPARQRHMPTGGWR